DAGLTVLDTFLTGSYQRSTMIAPLSEADIDIFAILDPKHYAANGQAGLLNTVRSVLRKTYTQTPDIRPDGQAVTIRFSDFKVDVVSGFYRTGGGYLIPDSQLGRWISTDPKAHVDLWADSNKAHQGDLVPLLKMLKAWNQSRNVLRSFHLETLARDVLRGVTITDFPSGLRYIFDKARAKIHSKLADPAGYSDDVAAYLNTEAAMDNVVKRLDWAFQQARDAEADDAAGRTAKAFERWRLLLPNSFPAYG
ncbi:MAG: nucleotidyltransferase, partial [Caulobacterales bacterium 68-7]